MVMDKPINNDSSNNNNNNNNNNDDDDDEDHDSLREQREQSHARTVHGLVDLLSRDSKDSFETTSRRLIRASVVTACLWLLFTAAVFKYSPPESFERIMDSERNCCSVAFVLLLMSNISRLLPLLYRYRTVTKGNTKIFKDGFLVAALTVQGIAMVACALMAFLPTPVIIDNVSGGRVFLVRWAEWAPLCFLLTFLSEQMDIPTPENFKTGLHHAVLQGVITCTGFIFPFIEDLRVWLALALIACVLYCYLFVRVYEKHRRLHDGSFHIDDPQLYDRIRLSLRALQECATIWTLLVTLHFIAPLAPRYLPDGHWLNTPALPMIAETCCEVASKHLHILVVESVFSRFSECARNDQTIDLLRRTMSVVWERSSDTIAVTIKEGEKQLCMVSPTFFNLVTDDAEVSKPEEPIAIVIEMSNNSSSKAPPPEQTSSVVTRVYCVAFSNESDNTAERVTPLRFPPHLMPNIESLADLLSEAWGHDSSSLLLHDFASNPTPATTTSAKQPSSSSSKIAHCEVTISKMKSTTMVTVIRDITERIKRFQAEKQLAVESTEREKDSQTNRFTRHEVKNGLLSAIGLCDNLKDLKRLESETSDEPEKTILSSESSVNGRGRRTNTASQCIFELEATLNEVLDTVLSEAMSRDVIHEAYDPREEKVDIRRLLDSTRQEEERFPVTSSPEELPKFFLDPQLFRFIHRNAISNACKYGKLGGIVATSLKYDSQHQILSVDIVNEPGERHEELVQLGEKAASQVFESGRRLHSMFGDSDLQDDREVSFSSGDGAWIMRKCARMLGGDVSICFRQERTVFQLAIPAKPVQEKVAIVPKEAFSIPKSTVGIAIDDSKVQRKLLDRLLSLLGIEKDNRIVLGATAEEVLDFNDYVKELIESTEDDVKFLIIADENLDIMEEANHRTLSGSLCIERLRQELAPRDEARMLALVRSANDSSEDLASYRERTHGFLRKAPIRKDNVLDMIYPLWVERFPAEEEDDDDDTEQQEEERPRKHILNRRASLRSVGEESEMSSSVSSESSGEERGTSVTTGADLLQIVESLDGLLLLQTPEAKTWPSIRDKFQVLKGDMMTLINRGSPRVVAVLEALEDLRAAEQMPADVEGRWKLIRALIVSLI